VAVIADPVCERYDERVRFAGRRRRPKRPAREAATNLALQESGHRFDQGQIARLPFSQREARAILDLVPPGQKMSAIGFNANLAAATGPGLAHYRLVHFATHGVLHTEHPEMSGIVLSLVNETGEPQSGFLGLSDIYNMKLAADLVVLSACQTALGKEIKGEGLIGLTRGFMYAGARRVAASLWKVDDRATSELMRRFYKHMLHDELRPAAALRSAQLEMWNIKRWQSPYFWSAFVIQGEWR
jgi:CHAT domain-containing protein